MSGANFHVTPEMEEEDFTTSQMASQLESSGSEFEISPRPRRAKRKKKTKKPKAAKNSKKSIVKKRTRTKRDKKEVAKKEVKRKTKVLKVYVDKGAPATSLVLSIPAADIKNQNRTSERQTRNNARVKGVKEDERKSRRKVEAKASPSIHEVEEFLDPPSRNNKHDTKTKLQKTSGAQNIRKHSAKASRTTKDITNKSRTPAIKPVGNQSRNITNIPKTGRKRRIPQPITTRGNVKKKKTQFLSKPAAKQRLKEYMLAENRPYTHTVLFDNLKQSVKKSMLPSLLAELADENVLTMKAWKKTIVYWANQDNFPSVTTSELANMDARIKELEIEKKTIDERRDGVSSEVRKLQKQPTDAELKAEMKELSSKAKDMRTRVDKLTKGSAPLIDIKMYEKLGKEFLKYFKHYKKRRAGCRKLAEGITEHLKQKPKDWLRQNCDMDEDYGIDYRSFKSLVDEWKERLKK